MKRLVVLALMAFLFPVLLIGEPVDSEDYIKTQYQTFERERGEKAFKVAQVIMDSIGAPVSFDADTDKDEIKAVLLKSLVSHYFSINEFDQVFEYAGVAIPFYRDKDDLMDVAGCYHTMGIASQYLGRFDDAINYYKMCSDVMEEIGGPMADRNRCYEINNMASIYLMMDECEQAEEMYLLCIDLLGEVGTDTLANRDLASYYQNLAGVWLEMVSKMDEGEEKTALVAKTVDYAEQSIDLSRRYGSQPDKMALRWITISKAHFEVGRVKEAQAEVDSAMAIIQELDLKYLETATYILKGDYAYRLGHYDEAEASYLEAASRAEENHFDEYCVESLNGAYLSTKKNHPERSIDYLERCKAWEDTVYNQEQQELIREYQVKYQTAEKEREIAVQQAENAKSRHRVTMLIIAVTFTVIVAVMLLYLAFKRRKQNELLKRRNKLKDRLFAVVSHDIKAPIDTQAQMLDMMYDHVETIPPAELKEGLGGMKLMANQMKEKLQNLICWVKRELGDDGSQASLFNLRELVQKVVDEQAAHAAMKSLVIVNEVPTEWEVFDDVNISRIVLQNLLSNAIKYSNPGGAIKLCAVEEGTRYRIVVEDNGVGINKEKLAVLLKKTTASEEGTQNEMGTGIGLMVSRQLTERIGSGIAIESIEGKGTKVSFTVNKG